MNYLSENYPDYDVDEYSNVYKNGKIMIPYNRGDYLQVYIYDKNHKGKLFGVYVVAAMKYLEYYEGCLVHHKDGNKMNNHISNLEILSRSEHSKHHMAGNTRLRDYVKSHGAWNKGKIITDPEYKRKMSEAQKARIKREGPRKFTGNQSVNANKMRVTVPISFDDPNIKVQSRYYKRSTKVGKEYRKKNNL